MCGSYLLSGFITLRSGLELFDLAGLSCGNPSAGLQGIFTGGMEYRGLTNEADSGALPRHGHSSG